MKNPKQCFFDSLSFRRAIRAIALPLLFVVIAAPLRAEIINPFPEFYNDDNGAISITPVNAFLVIDFSDTAPAFGPLTSFGFYFHGTDLNDPNNSAEIFDVTDQNLGGDPQLALVDMMGGYTYDLDDDEFQDFFSGFGDIGFWMIFEEITYYTDPALNNGGVDHAAIFQNKNPAQSNDYIIAFEVEVDGEMQTITFDLLDAPEIPAPGVAWLMLAGLVGWRAAGTARTRGSAAA